MRISRRLGYYELGGSEVKLVSLHDGQASLFHDPDYVPVPVATPLGGVRACVLVQYVCQPRVRLGPTVLNQ